MKALNMTLQQILAGEAAVIATLGATSVEWTVKAVSLRIVRIGVTKEILKCMVAPLAAAKLALVRMAI